MSLSFIEGILDLDHFAHHLDVDNLARIAIPLAVLPHADGLRELLQLFPAAAE